MTILRARGDTYSVLTSSVHLFPKSDDDDDGSKTASLNLGWGGGHSFVLPSLLSTICLFRYSSFFCLLHPLSVSQNPGFSCSLCSPNACKRHPEGEGAEPDYDHWLSDELPQYWWPEREKRETVKQCNFGIYVNMMEVGPNYQKVICKPK